MIANVFNYAPSLPQPIKFLGRKCTDIPANSRFSGSILILLLHLFSVLCILMKILSHASAKKKTKTEKGLRVSNFALLLLFSSDIMAVKGLISWS